MSIIHDALKKIQASGKIIPEVKPDQDYKPKPKFSPYLLYIIVASLGFFIASALFGLFARLLRPHLQAYKISGNITQAQVKTDNLAPASGIPAAAPRKPKEESRDRFVLNGVFFSEDEGYALINNRIVKSGDTIDDATVVGISSEEVELDSAGSIIKLTTPK